MCGIAGLLEFAPFGAEDRAHSAVLRMVEQSRHRGPDGEGLAAIESGASARVTLGHTRLAIIDLSEAGRQPMADVGERAWITFNGEIYNYQALRAQLGDPEAWASTSDTEVVLRAYHRWGRDCLEHLRGMFAFALWDARRNELFLARDRLGIKPLYYATTPQGAFLFGSEVRALLATGLLPRELDTIALDEYLAYQSVPAPRTLVRDVRCLPPGGWLTVDATGHISQGTYWDPLTRAQATAAPSDPAECRGRVAELLRESIRLHVVSDVPVGAFLSGGIDSTAIVALMHEAGLVPRTFSVAFSEADYDESAYARQVAQCFGADHTEIVLRERDLLDQLPDALAAMDQPTGDGINTYVVSRAVRDAGMKVALSGLGGDELFAGYPSFARLDRSARWLKVWGRVPEAMRAAVAHGVEIMGGASVPAAKTALMLASDGHLASVYPLTRQVLSPEQRERLFLPGSAVATQTRSDPYVDLLRKQFDDHSQLGTLTAVCFAESRTYMHDVLLRDTDQMSMSHALEVRVPFLDGPLVEWVMAVPDQFKRSNGTPKRLLVEALGGLLPDEVVHRPKQGFALPFDPWLRGPLRAFCESRLSPERTRSRGVLAPEAVTGMWTRFLEHGRDVSWSRVWVLVVLEEWLATNGF